MTNDEVPNDERMTNDETLMTNKLLDEALTNVLQARSRNWRNAR